MNLSFSDLKKRDVVNIVDGKSYGPIKDLALSFPKGVLTEIVVSASGSKGIFRIFDRSELHIEVKRILKIGSDVILVNLNCGDVCEENTPVQEKKCPPSPCGCGGQEGNIIDLDEYRKF